MGMEMADVGVRTRAQVLALAKRKKCGDQSEVASSSTFVPMKRRRRCSTKREKSALLATSQDSGHRCSGHVLEASCCSEQESLGNLGICTCFLKGDGNVEEVETSTGKETIDSSEPRVDSSTVQLASPEPNSSPAREPLAKEIEKFFVRAEKDLGKQFNDKYNYDFAKDVPLEGRYEWVVIKRTE